MTKRPHRRRTWTVQLYSLGGANVHPPSNICFLGPPESIPHTASWSVQPFLHSSRQKVPIAYNGRRLKRALAHGRIWTMSNTCFLGPTRVHNPNCVSIGSAVFAELTIVTGSPTDRPRYSACNNRRHLYVLRCGPNIRRCVC